MRRTGVVLLVGLAVVAAGIAASPSLRVNPYFYFAGYVDPPVRRDRHRVEHPRRLRGLRELRHARRSSRSGAYTAVFLIQSVRAPLPVLILAGGLVSALLGLGIGYLTLRLRGVFFSIATLALSVVLQTVIINWEYVGGSRGLSVHPPERAALRQLRDVPLHGDGRPRRRRGADGAVHRALLDRPRARRAARQRGGGRVHGRADPAPQALRHHGQRLPAGRGRRARSRTT